MTTRRERYRQETLAEIKALALRQLDEGGAEALSLNVVARDLGLSRPALYRYFASRDALLGELVVDAYRELGAALAAGDGDAEPAARLRAWMHAYRRWALANPTRYRLLLGPRAPGAEPAAAERAASELMAPVLDALRAWGSEEAVLRPVWTMAWATLHGFVSLELAGRLAPAGAANDADFDIIVAELLRLGPGLGP